MTVSVCQPSKCVRRSPKSIYGNQERRMALLDKCYLLGRTPGSELGYDLIRTKLLTEIDSIYQPQSSKISEKQKEKKMVESRKNKDQKRLSDIFPVKKIQTVEYHVKAW